MPKQEAISYKANFKEEVDEESGAVTSPEFSYSGTVLYNMPDSLAEAAQMFGEGPALSCLLDQLKIRVQAICRRNRTQDEAQEAVNGYIPGITIRGSGPTQKQVKEVLSKMSKQDIEKLLASLE